MPTMSATRVIRTNWQAPNYRLMTVRDGAAGDRAAVDRPGAARSRCVIVEFKPFNGFVAIEERSGGNKRLRLLANGGKSSL